MMLDTVLILLLLLHPQRWESFGTWVTFLMKQFDEKPCLHA